MKQKKLFLSFISLFLSISLGAQSVKAMYVNDFVNIIDNSSAENILLNQAQSNGYNYLILYNLYTINNTLFDITDLVASQPLADFIEKARTMYGITQVAGVGETYNSFTNIHDYNLDHAGNPDQQFDHYNIEFEFWNDNLVDPGKYYCTTYLQPLGLPCDTSGSFQFYKDNLCDLQALCAGFVDLDSETYIGWPNMGQSKQIADCTERVLVHYYRSSDVYMSGNSIYNYGVHRLPDLATSDDVSVVMPIFNCQPSFMDTWLETHPEDQAFDTWMTGLNGYNDDMGAWKANNIVDGHVWFKYTCMPVAPMPLELIYFSGRKTAKANLLTWQIAVANGLKEMIIERAEPQQSNHFMPIMTIKQPYGIHSSYLDNHFSAGTNLYRLKFIDKDGTFEYSKTISFDNSTEKLRVQWYPNTSSAHLRIHNLVSQKATINVLSISGQTLLSKPVFLHRGENRIPINSTGLARGVYIFSIQVGEKSYFIKWIK